jgi:rubrerythrin
LFKDSIKNKLENNTLEENEKFIKNLLETRVKYSKHYSDSITKKDRFICQKCGYNTIDDQKIDTADQVAAYNIANTILKIRK